MPTLNTKLTNEEQREASKFFNRLSSVDFANVKGLLEVIDDVAREYLTSNDVDGIETLIALDGRRRIPVPFFTTFAIGGQITKQGDRPDIDLLLATNMRYWSEEELDQYSPVKEALVDKHMPIRERLLAPLFASVKGKFILEYGGPVPYSYCLGKFDDKFLARFKPREDDSGKPIDFVYVNTGHTTFVDEAEFLGLDVDENDVPLPKLPIQRLSLEGYVPPVAIF